ncbi:FASCICLIN-LIKE ARABINOGALACTAN PROTEIN [Salix viminalis]|uniref:FASCICLIN-LIKE ARABINOGALACTAN PROTEIN n=1 Tax=Salix viminalis TaxID=40686 RepID=A0A9Q0QKH0_SALVM|nr:FASCICLIN-LIKE ARABINOGALACTAN PROTEIN [Salix viminalis]
MPPPTTPVKAPPNAPSQAPSAQVATSPGPVDVGKILQKAGHFTVFVRLMQATTEDAELNKELNTTNNGITIFAPSDNAFSSLKSGFLNALSDEDKTELVKFHVLPALVSSSQFQTVSNPVRTQAGTGPRVTLNVTTTGNFVNISTGLTNTSISGTVYTDSQLAIYQIDKVLFPVDIFTPKPPAPAPAPELGKPGKAAAGAESPTAPKDISGALTPLILVHNNALTTCSTQLYGCCDLLMSGGNVGPFILVLITIYTMILWSCNGAADKDLY